MRFVNVLVFAVGCFPTASHSFSVGAHRDAWVHGAPTARWSARRREDEATAAAVSFKSPLDYLDSTGEKPQDELRDELHLMGETLVAILAGGVDSEKAVSKAMRR